MRKKRKPKKPASPGKVLVNSHTYEPHERNARGSFSAAPLNDTLQAKADSTPRRNAAASPVYRFLQQAGGRFMEGELWGRMLRRMHKAGGMDAGSFLRTLEGMEAREDYPLDRFSALPVVTAVRREAMLRVDLAMRGHPRFKRQHTDCYYYDAGVLFMNEMLQTECCITSTEWVYLTDEVPSYEMDFLIPADATACLIFLKLNGGEKGRETDVFKDMALRVMVAGNMQF